MRLPFGVWVIAGLLVVALMVVAGRYGFHRDEYYFVVTGEHPAIAAPDNPMLVPYLAAGWYGLVGGNLWAFRILPALAAGSYVVIGALIGREFSSSRAHQVGAAAATGLLAIVLATGHLFGTTIFDMLITAAALWMLIRALYADPQRWAPWIGFGVLSGVAMEIKVLAALVMVCCLAGVLILGPRRPLASAKPWIATLIGDRWSHQRTADIDPVGLANNAQCRDCVDRETCLCGETCHCHIQHEGTDFVQVRAR